MTFLNMKIYAGWLLCTDCTECQECQHDVAYACQYYHVYIHRLNSYIMVLNMYIFKYVVQTLNKHDNIDMHCIYATSCIF